MAWLPSSIHKDINSASCLVCSRNVTGFSKDVANIEVMKVICHIVHVNWEELSEELDDGKSPLCGTCYKIILDLAKFSEELQLIENQLRSKVKDIQRIVVDHVGGIQALLSQRPSRRHLAQKSLQAPNSFQRHFIEESRNWELMRRKVNEYKDELVIVEPSSVQIHLDVGCRCYVPKNEPCPPEHKFKNQTITERVPRRKTQLPKRYEEETIIGDVRDDNEETMDFDDQPPAAAVEEAETDMGSCGSDKDYSGSGSGSESDASEPGNKKPRRSMIALREPWRMKRVGDRIYFKDIEIIKKKALPPDDEKYKYILECGSCGKEIGQPLTGTPSADSRYINMKRHITAMHFATYRCEPCNKVLSGPKALKYHQTTLIHLRRHGGYGAALTNKVLKKGIAIDPDGKLYYKGIEIIKVDYEDESGYEIRCSRCPKVVTSEEAQRRDQSPYSILIKHLNGSHKAGPFNCSLCGKVYAESRNLETHFRLHHTVNPPKIDCHICGKQLSHKISLRKHVWIHRNEEERAAAIAAGEKAPVRYKEFVQLRREKMGLTDAAFQCAECGKVFELMCQLKRHESSHVVKRYECALCGTIFPTYQERFEHTKSVHKMKTVKKKYYCSLCPKTFKLSEELLKHEESGHSKMPYSCPVCSAGFALEHTLNRHVKRCRNSWKRRKTTEVVTSEITSPEEVEYEVLEETEVIPVSEQGEIELAVATIEGAVVARV